MNCYTPYCLCNTPMGLWKMCRVCVCVCVCVCIYIYIYIYIRTGCVLVVQSRSEGTTTRNDSAYTECCEESSAPTQSFAKICSKEQCRTENQGPSFSAK